jgi:hypothetical protein
MNPRSNPFLVMSISFTNNAIVEHVNSVSFSVIWSLGGHQAAWCVPYEDPHPTFLRAPPLHHEHLANSSSYPQHHLESSQLIYPRAPCPQSAALVCGISKSNSTRPKPRKSFLSSFAACRNVHDHSRSCLAHHPLESSTAHHEIPSEFRTRPQP